MGAIRSSTRPSRRVVGTRRRSSDQGIHPREVSGGHRPRGDLQSWRARRAPRVTRRSRPHRARGELAARPQYKIGYSNGGGVGNGFREEQVCTAKAQAKASGKVSELVTNAPQHRRGGPASDIRDLIAAGVKAIVFNPNDKAALNPALAGGEGCRDQDGRCRRVRHRPRHLQPVQQPGQVRRARRQVAVRPARRQGHRLVHARPRRPSGRQRP